MRLLLDTRTFLWWLSGSERLSTPARRAIADEANEILVSAASAWEITTKHRLGKLSGSELIAQDVPSGISGQGFTELGITVHDASRAGSLAGPLRDPFDRMLIAQALVHDLVLVSNETVFDRYGARRLW